LGDMRRTLRDDGDDENGRTLDPVREELQGFDGYMRDVCGLSEATRLQRGRIVEGFLLVPLGNGTAIDSANVSQRLAVNRPGFAGDRVQIPSFTLHNDEIKQITMVGSDAGPLKWQLFTNKTEGLYITVKDRRKSPIACAFRIELND